MLHNIAVIPHFLAKEKHAINYAIYSVTFLVFVKLPSLQNGFLNTSLCHKVELYQGREGYQKEEEMPLYCGTLSVAVTSSTVVMCLAVSYYIGV